MVFCVTCFLGGQMEISEEIFQKWVLIQLLYCSCICILLFFLGKGKFSTVLQMKWVLWFGLLVTVFRIYPDYKNGLLAGGLYTIRFFFASFACQLIFETTSSLEIREGFEDVHKVVCKVLPFMKNINLAFVISLAVTFIPEVFETWNKVRLAKKARQGKNRRFFQNLLVEITALLSVLLGLAETKRKAILNRGFSI
ncbi:MAG: energy-coupling factor transporter transmembrane protein EcfT [Treponema sp.]|nr:energy-coupling factor transporter transmembrane protein EcfT [Treponema sp.]